MKKRILFTILALSYIDAQVVYADTPATLTQVVETAVLENPEVMQSYNNFEASVSDKDAAFGRYLPSVDVTGAAGYESRNDPLMKKDFGRYQGSVILKQMLFDGFATSNEVERLERVSKSKLYQLESVSQSVAFDTSRTFIDLLRYRQIATLAEDNYVAHKIIYEQLKLKAESGVGKMSDVEQARSRVALSDYNMSVAAANLHDIEARYQRLIGKLPPNGLDSNINVNKDIPESANLAISKAQANNPLLLASIEDTQSQMALVKNKNAPFMPRFDFRAHADYGYGLNGITGTNGTVAGNAGRSNDWQDNAAEVVMTWNIFNGFSDYNVKNRERSLLESSYDRRDKTCRDIRLEIEIAYNDIRKLTEQGSYLDTRVISIEKARDAYRKQFDIGQRTLVDLLNAENELFEAKRLYINTVNDLSVAYLKTHYQTGSILNVLGLSRYAANDAPLPAAGEATGEGLATCPAEAPGQYKPDREKLDSRVSEAL